MADTAVARAGKPGMGVASCFGSPLLNDVLGLSVALIVSLLIDQYHDRRLLLDYSNLSGQFVSAMRALTHVSRLLVSNLPGMYVLGSMTFESSLFG